MVQLLYELMKDSRRSDRSLAKALKVSQPTITRMRKRLEDQEYIQEYTVVPDLAKLGFEIVVVTSMNMATYDAKTGEKAAEMAEKAHNWIANNPKIVFAAPGAGVEGRNALMVSVHKDFTDFRRFISDFRQRGGSHISNIESFLITVR
ncbi:MAG: Lrp/AsnC family transcriptional regulator, partial [Thermoproteota archaeon]|nr:Lrp/AsnC family transcriptional regulator [Thermoproteota archaeon]